MKQSKALAGVLFYISIVFARLPENPGLSVIDAGTGAGGNSPMINAIYNIEPQKIILEIGAVSYYDTPIFSRGEQLTNFFCGALYRVGQNRFSLSMNSLNAFDLYFETNIRASYGVSLLRFLHLGLSGDYLLYRLENERILGTGLDFSAGAGNRIIMGVFSYYVRNIGDGEYNPVIQEIKASVRFSENRFGSQAAVFKINDYTRRISAELAYAINLHEYVNFGVSFIPKPFVIKMGLVFNVKQTRTFAAFSLHNALGLSKYLGMQYLLE